MSRCRKDSHYFPPFNESSDLGGGAQNCECGAVLIDRTLGGGRKVEISRASLRSLEGALPPALSAGLGLGVPAETESE